MPCFTTYVATWSVDEHTYSVRKYYIYYIIENHFFIVHAMSLSSLKFATYVGNSLTSIENDNLKLSSVISSYILVAINNRHSKDWFFTYVTSYML